MSPLSIWTATLKDNLQKEKIKAFRMENEISEKAQIVSEQNQEKN